MTNHHVAQILAYVLYDVAQQQKELQKCRNDLAKEKWFSVYVAWDLLRNSSGSSLNRITLRQFLQSHSDCFPLMNNFSLLWLSICDADGIFSLASFTSWFPNDNSVGDGPYQLSIQDPRMLSTSLAKLFNHHTQCCVNVKKIARQRLTHFDLNTFLLVDVNGDGVISRDDIELFMNAHNVNIKHAPFDVAGSLLEFFKVSPYQGINLREWARVFHAPSTSFRYVGTPVGSRRNRGSLTPSLGRPTSFSSPITPNIHTHRMRRAKTWSEGPNDARKRQYLQSAEVKRRRYTTTKFPFPQSDPFVLQKESSSKSNKSGHTHSDRTVDYSGRSTDSPENHGNFHSKSRSRVLFTPGKNDKISRSSSVRSRRSRVKKAGSPVDFHRAQLSTLEKRDKFTSSMLIQKKRPSRTPNVSKTNYISIFSSKRQSSKSPTPVYAYSSFKTPTLSTCNQAGEKLLRLSDLESSPLDFSEEEKTRYSSTNSESPSKFEQFMELG